MKTVFVALIMAITPMFAQANVKSIGCWNFVYVGLVNLKIDAQTQTFTLKRDAEIDWLPAAFEAKGEVIINEQADGSVLVDLLEQGQKVGSLHAIESDVNGWHRQESELVYKDLIEFRGPFSPFYCRIK